MYKMQVIIIKNKIKVQNKLSIFTSSFIKFKNLVIVVWIIFVEKTCSMA